MASPAFSPPVGQTPVLRIQASRRAVPLNLADLWEYRELIYFLTWRDLKVRYKQTVLGAAWAVIQPFFTMLVFSLFFGRLAGMPSDGVAYPLFCYAALVPWTFFSSGLLQSANSLVGNTSLIKKVYFPRMTIVVASVAATAVDFGCAFLVLLAMMLYYGVSPSWSVVWLPCFVALAFAAALGVGLWLSALNLQFRDVKYAMPFLVQFWMFATPIAYPSSLLAQPWRALYGLNPMVGVVDGFRWALLSSTPAPVATLAPAVLVSGALLVSGAYYFRHTERTFADIV